MMLSMPAFGAAAGGCSSTPDYKKQDEQARKEKPVESEGKRWGGWRWKGKRGDCFFKHDNECFKSLEDACKSAGCGKDECKHDDSAPAKVSCPEKKSKKSKKE